MAERERKSILNVVQSNFKSIHFTTYVTRFAYFGEYFHSSEELQALMKDIIGALRADVGEDLVTGLLLVYPKCYVHLLEGPEDVIYMHFKDLCRDRDENKFGKTILLPTYHHVYHKFFTDWYNVYTSAPSLLDRIEKQTMEEIKRQVSNCFLKLYNLCDQISKAIDENTDKAQDILNNLNEKFPQYLPESNILEYLLNAKSSVLKTVEDYLRIYSEVPFVQFYNDTIWPPPLDTIPRYTLKYIEDRNENGDTKKNE